MLARMQPPAKWNLTKKAAPPRIDMRRSEQPVKTVKNSFFDVPEDARSPLDQREYIVGLEDNKLTTVNGHQHTKGVIVVDLSGRPVEESHSRRVIPLKEGESIFGKRRRRQIEFEKESHQDGGIEPKLTFHPRQYGLQVPIGKLEYNEDLQKLEIQETKEGLDVNFSQNVLVEVNHEDYDECPVEDFGAALLRGMGWTEKSPDSHNNSMCPIERVKSRPLRLGLGAKPSPLGTIKK